LLARWQQQPADPSLRTAVVDVIVEELRAKPEFKTGLLSALNLAEQPAVAQPAEPGAATVTAGRDQKFRGNINIGSGALTVNRQRTIRLGLGGALAVLMVSGVTTGVMYLRQGDQAAPQRADSPAAVSSPAAAKPLSMVAADQPGHGDRHKQDGGELCPRRHDSLRIYQQRPWLPAEF
jgi:hypothetical protein